MFEELLHCAIVPKPVWQRRESFYPPSAASCNAVNLCLPLPTEICFRVYLAWNPMVSTYYILDQLWHTTTLGVIRATE